MSKFGWCSTGHHDQCRTSYYDDWSATPGERVCSCDCHTEGTVSEEPVKKTRKKRTPKEKKDASSDV